MWGAQAWLDVGLDVRVVKLHPRYHDRGLALDVLPTARAVWSGGWVRPYGQVQVGYGWVHDAPLGDVAASVHTASIGAGFGALWRATGWLWVLTEIGGVVHPTAPLHDYPGDWRDVTLHVSLGIELRP